MASRSRNEPDETAELKRLLFAPELELLDRVRERTAALHHRVGDDLALTDSIRRVLADVLQQTTAEDRERVAAMLAPLILDTVRDEIRRSRQDAVAAIQPAAGRMVRAGVADTLGGGLDALAWPFDRLLSPTLWSARASAWRSGRPVRQVLTERSRRFTADQATLFHRPTGLTIAESRTREAGADQDALLTAVDAALASTFAGVQTDAVADLPFGQGRLHLSVSPQTVLAVCSWGRTPDDLPAALAAVHRRLERRWAERIERYDGALAPADLATLSDELAVAADDLQPLQAAQPLYRPIAGRIVLGLLAVGLIGWLAFAGYRAWIDPAGAPARQGPNMAGNAAPAVQQAQPDAALAARVAALEGRRGGNDGVDPISRVALWLAQHPIQFDSGVGFADLRTAAVRLDAVAQVIRGWNLDMPILIVGYADARERRAGALSQDRANAVRQALIDRGIGSERIRAVGRGAAHPVAEAGSDQNRRASFEIAWR